MWKRKEGFLENLEKSRRNQSIDRNNNSYSTYRELQKLKMERIENRSPKTALQLFEFQIIVQITVYYKVLKIMETIHQGFQRSGNKS